MSTPDLRHLRQFVAVAEELHFGRAARRLHITQPPLTMAIRQLEAQLGVPVFSRTSRSVQLTPAGEALLPAARRLLADADGLVPLARAASEGSLGRLRLGFVSTVGYGPLPGWLRSFRELHPGVHIELREATLDVQLAAFEAGRMDAGFVSHADDAVPTGYARLGVAVEEQVIALPAEHALALSHAETVPIAAALAEPLLVYPRGIAPSLYDALLSFYAAHGVVPSIAQEAIQMQTLVNLVSTGMGLAWVPESMMQLQRPGVVYRRVVGTSPPAWHTSLLWLPSDAPPAVDRFVTHVASQLTQGAGGTRRRAVRPRSGR